MSRRIDILVAEHVMGYTGLELLSENVPSYSTDSGSAHLVLEKICKTGDYRALVEFGKDYTEVTLLNKKGKLTEHTELWNTFPLAVCILALNFENVDWTEGDLVS